jgi:hypothetical protein
LGKRVTVNIGSNLQNAAGAASRGLQTLFNFSAVRSEICQFANLSPVGLQIRVCSENHLTLNENSTGGPVLSIGECGLSG